MVFVTWDALRHNPSTPLTYSTNAEQPRNVSRSQFDGAVPVDNEVQNSKDAVGWGHDRQIIRALQTITPARARTGRNCKRRLSELR